MSEREKEKLARNTFSNDFVRNGNDTGDIASVGRIITLYYDIPSLSRRLLGMFERNFPGTELSVIKHR